MSTDLSKLRRESRLEKAGHRALSDLEVMESMYGSDPVLRRNIVELRAALAEAADERFRLETDLLNERVNEIVARNLARNASDRLDLMARHRPAVEVAS